MRKGSAALSEPVRIRFSRRMSELLKTRAREKRVGMSALVRQICEQYFENEFADTTLISRSLTGLSREIARLSDRTEMAAVIALETARHQIARLPENGHMSGERLESAFEEFARKCAGAFDGAHRGKLESMVLDFYERTEDGGKAE